MSEALRLYNDRFAVGNPRSPEYKAGARYCLRYHAGEIPRAGCPYPMGTAQADAWLAGCWEGTELWRYAHPATADGSA